MKLIFLLFIIFRESKKVFPRSKIEEKIISLFNSTFKTFANQTFIQKESDIYISVYIHTLVFKISFLI